MRLHRIRVRGPYEEWLARCGPPAPVDGLVMARLPHPERPDPAALSARLASAAAAARKAEHQASLHCHGTVDLTGGGVAQLLELHTGLDLEALFSYLRGRGQRLPLPLAIWVLRNAAEAVAHAHSLSVVHGSLSPALVALLPEGEVKVDFGLCGGAGAIDDAALTDLVDLRYTRPEWTAADTPRTPEMDVWGLAAMLLEALTGAPPTPAFDVAAPRVDLTAVPESLRGLIAEALAPDGPRCSAVTLANGLARAFYKTLGADDERDGRAPLLVWLERAGGTDPAVAGALNDNADTEYPLPSSGQPSDFTAALCAREGPVQPSDLSTADFGVDPSGPQWPPPPDMVTDADAPPTEAVAMVQAVPPDAQATARVISTPEVEAAGLRAHALPMPSATAATPPTHSSHSSVSPTQLRRPSRLTWFLGGFAATLVLLVLLRTVLD